LGGEDPTYDVAKSSNLLGGKCLDSRTVPENFQILKISDLGKSVILCSFLWAVEWIGRVAASTAPTLPRHIWTGPNEGGGGLEVYTGVYPGFYPGVLVEQVQGQANYYIFYFILFISAQSVGPEVTRDLRITNYRIQSSRRFKACPADPDDTIFGLHFPTPATDSQVQADPSLKEKA